MKVGALSVGQTQDDLAEAAAVNDIATVGRLLGMRDVNATYFNDGELQQSLVRRPFECSLLDVSVGSGSVELTKCLFEFHGAKSTREILRQSIATGSLELIKLMRERLPEEELRGRVDLMEVAAEFHQLEVLAWLFRDAGGFAREPMGVFALERKLADSLVVAFESGFSPWWSGTREAASKWRASAKVELVPAPDGFSGEGGWWTSESGIVWALPLGGEAGLGWAQRKLLSGPGIDGASSDLGSAWTKALSQGLRGKESAATSIVLPSGVTAIGDGALKDFEALEMVVLPASCTVFGKSAFAYCASLEAVSLPAGCRATGICAFLECRSLSSVTIPVGCRMISDGSFSWCKSLTRVQIPKGCRVVGMGAFAGSSIKHVVTPEGCEIGSHAFMWCRSLAAVTICAGCTTIGVWTFCGCTALASMTLPSTLKSIGEWAFGDCPALATIAMPKGCHVHTDAFKASATHVVKL
jgi:hypothetical protein